MRRPLHRFVHLLIWFVALAPPVVAVGYLMYANLINPRVIQRLTGNYDGLYWDAAQLQIAYGRFENQLLRYADGLDHDPDQLRLRYEVLQSKLNVMNGSARGLSGSPARLKRQRDDLDRLSATVASFGPQLDRVANSPALAHQMVAALREHWTEINDLALSRRFADITEREEIRRDFIAKRRELFAAGLVLIVLCAAAAVLLVLNGYRRTRLIRQQHALLKAELQASRAAREASTAKDTFLGMISHELRTPLHAIVSSIELLGLKPLPDEDRKVIQRLDTAARQLEAQMKDLTDYARLGAGKLELRHEQFDPRELLQSIVDQNEAAARARGLAFESALRGVHGLVESDPHRIRQIANNLVTNAIRYTERGVVRIEFVASARALSMVVSDTGPGVPPEQIPLIFREFTQLDASRSRRYEGAGMGLAIVRGLVDLFGGAIATDSRVGEGTTFTVTIPVTPVAGPLAADARTPGRGDGERPRVLVVDDNRPVRESLCEMVALMGCDALAACDADAALAIVGSTPCDVVLLDLNMPGRDGYGFVAGLDAALKGRALHRPRLIAVSADLPDATACDASTPFFDCLAKPVHYEVLRAALQRALVLSQPLSA
ncbi:ATP-binding response regulator [Paraburkholderia caballeronis]|uniref:Virulence sensor protein BvgS n=1 Tax=Paraburkholderia caballeronis TaxID=416943 RepID=A0A1H7UHN3_9BURK|nr:ATP-binding protein [Paraburkholderia caballeronis]PXW17507.1 signal transduction histidine kinase [Paraburkholderia caballeronis]PXW95096.1 signal transduction histidine kinase [Paraburkholderia caballeronis]RAJ90942.1 signal transduction histidine kinase [Paraburkholderia caballeronis]TDV07837.1 signal transduction histidine kinase [Paraburkholderia caballeronis]TDV11200.1 signal transduction histidine kinase [Paraburkholderia caballeronis]